MSTIVEVPVVKATAENTREYGLFVGTDVPNAGLTIPFYKGAVEEGHNLPFACRGDAVIRTARIHKRSGDLIWLERHLHMTQLFVGLGDQPFAMVLGKPTQDREGAEGEHPNLDDVVCFVLPPGHGIMIHQGTWHDFPMAVEGPVTVLTANSPEVVAALASQKEPAEMNRGDVFKIDVVRRTGKQLHVSL